MIVVHDLIALLLTFHSYTGGRWSVLDEIFWLCSRWCQEAEFLRRRNDSTPDRHGTNCHKLFHVCYSCHCHNMNHWRDAVVSLSWYVISFYLWIRIIFRCKLNSHGLLAVPVFVMYKLCQVSAIFKFYVVLHRIVNFVMLARWLLEFFNGLHWFLLWIQ